MTGHQICHSGTLHKALFDNSKRGCSGSSISTKTCTEISCRYFPMCHKSWERHQKEHTSGKGWVEHILTDTSESHLSDSDCDQSSDKDNPKRNCRWKIKCQKDTCNNSGHISDCTRSLKKISCDEILQQHAGNYAHCKH